MTPPHDDEPTTPDWLAEQFDKQDAYEHQLLDLAMNATPDQLAAPFKLPKIDLLSARDDLLDLSAQEWRDAMAADPGA